MSKLLSAAQMRAIEQAAIRAGDVTGLELMERAGQGVVDAIFAQWPDLGKTSYRAVVLCGPGNNGGDGFVVARLLKTWGWTVDVYLLGAADRLPPDARVNHDRWVRDGRCEPLSKCQIASLTPRPDLVIDALFGTGLSRGIEGDAARLIGELKVPRWDFGVKIVAVDIPSGICADSGRPLGPFAPADLTVTFHSEKLGHHLAAAGGHCACVVVSDIGLSHDGQSPEPGLVRKVRAPEAGLLGKAGVAHKYDCGHALVLSGGFARTGAARLAARGALRVGAGLVTLGVPPNAQMEVASQITALMLVRIADDEALAKVLQDDRINALCLGPGLGLEKGEGTRALVERAVRPPGAPRGVVLDADALTAFAGDPGQLFDMLHGHCILTPHGGEFARLFPDIAKRLCQEPKSGPAYSRVDATRAAARRAGCVILLKGPDTVIAGPDGQCAVHSAQYERSAPWLATAGSGDVLAGLITGLLARGFAPIQAAETAAWLHVQCALSYGPGLIAEDIAEELPRVLRAPDL